MYTHLYTLTLMRKKLQLNEFMPIPSPSTTVFLVVSTMSNTKFSQICRNDQPPLKCTYYGKF